MRFGNLSYFPAALTLFQVAVVQQQKSDPSTCWSGVEMCWHPTDDTEPAELGGTKQLLLNMISSSSAGNIFFSWINGALLLYYPFLKITYFVWSYATLRSAGRVVRGASEHLLRILPAAGRLCKWHFLLQWKWKRCTIRARKCTLRN